MQKENLFFVYTLFILFFVSASLCSIADPVNSYVIKQGSGYLIVARNIFGENITTGGDEFFAIAAGEPFVQYASSAEASDYYKGYPPSEATGEPNVEICGDSRNAWSQYSPGRYDWLELKYNTTVFPLSVFLYETADSAPCVQNISTAGYSQNIFLENFIDTSSCPAGKLTEDFTPTRIDIGYHWLVNRVNLTVHCRGYAEIDSVALFGSPAIFLNVSDNEDGTYFVNTSSVAEEYLTLYVSLSFATVTGSPIKLATNEEGSSCSRAIYTSVPSTTEGNLLSAEIGNGCLSSSFPPSSGLWYSLIGTGNIIEVSTCGSVGPNTGISVYTGNCSLSSSLSCISYSFSNFSQKCNCQTNGRTGNALEFQSTLGVQYFIFVQQIEESVVGNFFLTIKDNITHIPPENDICISAKLMEIGETQKGTIQDSTADTINTCNGVIAETEGIWYTFAGTNKKIVFSTCNTEFPHTVTIFTGECGLLCPEENIFSNDNFCDSNYGASFTVPTYDGSVYYVLIKNTTCVSPHTEVEVKLDTIQYCPFGDLYFENYPLDPLSVQYSYCQWKSPSSTLGALSTLTLDPNSLYFSNDSVIDFTLYSNCGDQIYQVTTLSATDVFTSVNGFIVEITNVAGVAFVNASITTQPFASNVRAPPLNSWGKFSADKLYCNMSKMYTSDKPFLTVTANNYLYAVQEYGSAETTFLVRMFNIETAELDYVVQLDTSASSELPSPNYGGYSFVNYNDKVYVFGGYTQTKNSGPSNYPTVVNGPDSFYELDPVSKLITKIPLTGVITGRSEASLSAYKNYIVVFGGMYYGQIRDTYPSIITIIDMDLTPILAKEPSIKGPHPVGRILHTSVVYGDCLYIFGGSFDRFTYFGDFWRFNISSLSWTLLGNYTGQSDFPAARTGHVAILYKDSMVMFGGGYKFVPFKDMWSYNFTTATWTSLPVGPNIEVPVIDYASAAVAGGVILAVAAIDNLEYTRFNAIPVFQYTIEDICLSYEADGCHACPAGTYVMDTFIQGVCFSCPVGSFSSVSSSPSCSLCPPAMYQDQESQESCFYCPAGFYGNASGSTSVNSCNPCSYGSFSALPGSTSCYSCPSGAFCPLGSIQPLSIKEFSDVVSSSEAAFQAEDTDRYKEIEYKFLWIIAGFIFLWILFVIVIIIMKCANAKSLYRRVQRVDVLNITKYNIPGPVLKTRSIMGGVVSALALFIILGLLVYVSVTYRYNNDMITAGLVAGLSRTTDVVTNHLNISVQLVGFSGQCETSIQGQCSPGITVSQTGFSKIGETKCTTIDSSTCIMSWSVNAGNKVQNPSDVTFQIFSEPASTYAMRWNVTADSVYDGRYTYVSGDTYPDSLSNVFRGLPTDPPSLIQLSIIPTTLTFWNKHDRNREGVTLNFLARGTGHQVNESSFYEEGQVLGFSVKFEFEIPQFIYQKTVNQRETAFAMASMYIALVGGVFSVSRIALQIYFNCKHVTSRRSAKTVNTEDVEYESLLNITEEEENVSVS